MKDDRVYLGHILRCLSRIEEYVSGSREAFASHIVQDAVLRNLQTMAESSQRLSPAADAGGGSSLTRRLPNTPLERTGSVGRSTPGARSLSG